MIITISIKETIYPDLTAILFCFITLKQKPLKVLKIYQTTKNSEFVFIVLKEQNNVTPLFIPL